MVLGREYKIGKDEAVNLCVLQRMLMMRLLPSPLTEARGSMATGSEVSSSGKQTTMLVGARV